MDTRTLRQYRAGRKEQIHEQKFNQGLIFACVDYNDSDTGGLHRFGGGTRE